MSESTSFSMMGSVLKQTQDREGVHIDTPHGWVINDVHHAWTKNETYHWETGNIFHMTSGQVLHVNLNTVEVHATTSVLTMHVDITPLNVHIIPLPIGIDVHIEASHLRKHVNIHGGHHHQLVSNFHQESQAVHIASTVKAPSGWDKWADRLAHGPEQPGAMILEADEAMTLKGNSIVLKTVDAYVTVGELAGYALIYADKYLILKGTKTCLAGDGPVINLRKDNVELENGKGASIKLSDANITTEATKTELKGRVEIGQPAITGMAQEGAVAANTKDISDVMAVQKAQAAALQAQINRLRRRLKGK